MHLLAGWWAAVWPNLAASVLWTVPVLFWQHRRFGRRLEAHHHRLWEALKEEFDAEGSGEEAASNR